MVSKEEGGLPGRRHRRRGARRRRLRLRHQRCRGHAARHHRARQRPATTRPQGRHDLRHDRPEERARVRHRDRCSAVGLTIEAQARAELGTIEGEGFLARLESVSDDLAEALTSVYGDDAEELQQVLVRDALEASVARAEPLRVLDRRREVDPSWFLREDMVGYVCYADRFAGDLEPASRTGLDYLGELGVALPAPDAAAAAARGRERRRLRRRGLRLRRPAAGHDGTTSSGWPASCTRAGSRSASTSCSTTPRRSTRGPSKALAGDPTYRDFYRFFPDRTEPDAYERTLPEVFPDMAPGSFTYLAEHRRVGVDDVPRVPVGPQLGQPEGLPRDARGDAHAGQPRRRRACGSTRRRSCGSGWAPTARTSRRRTGSCRRSRR